MLPSPRRAGPPRPTRHWSLRAGTASRARPTSGWSFGTLPSSRRSAHPGCPALPRLTRPGSWERGHPRPLWAPGPPPRALHSRPPLPSFALAQPPRTSIAFAASTRSSGAPRASAQPGSARPRATAQLSTPGGRGGWCGGVTRCLPLQVQQPLSQSGGSLFQH